MNLRFGSCAKSTVSIDSDSCQRQACIQLRKKWQSLHENSGIEDQAQTTRQQLCCEIDRQGRKISILQKSKELLVEELNLIKQELANQLKKVKRLQKQIYIQKEEQTTFNNEQSGYSPSLAIILQQKEEHIDYLSQQLKSKQRQNSEIKYLNQQLQEQIASKIKTFQTIQESWQAQLSFQNKQVTQLELQLEQKDRELNNIKKIHRIAIEKEEKKWEGLINRLQNKIQLLQQEGKHQKQNYQKLQNICSKLKISKKQSEQLLKQQKQKVTWLNHLIEQAKIQYIHSELKNQQLRQLVKKDRAKKKYKVQLSNGNKSFRSISEASTCLPSAKTLTSHPYRTAVTPFQMSPCKQERQEAQPGLSEQQCSLIKAD